jgi:hypothetical protein
MSAVEYTAAPSARFDRKKVQVYGDALAALESKHGGVTPEAIVREAESKRSPFHDLFTWDDAQAGQKHRLYEARKFIGWIRVELEYVGDRTPKVLNLRPVRAMHSVKDAEGNRKYVSIATIKRNANYKQQIKDECAITIEALASKLATFEDLDAFVVKLRKMAEQLRKVA